MYYPAFCKPLYGSAGLGPMIWEHQLSVHARIAVQVLYEWVTTAYVMRNFSVKENYRFRIFLHNDNYTKNIIFTVLISWIYQSHTPNPCPACVCTVQMRSSAANELNIRILCGDSPMQLKILRLKAFVSLVCRIPHTSELYLVFSDPPVTVVSMVFFPWFLVRRFGAWVRTPILANSLLQWVEIALQHGRNEFLSRRNSSCRTMRTTSWAKLESIDWSLLQQNHMPS